ncbi:MAG: helix-turn-helix domain-containing protein [Crocosphaera sp.]
MIKESFELNLSGLHLAYSHFLEPLNLYEQVTSAQALNIWQRSSGKFAGNLSEISSDAVGMSLIEHDCLVTSRGVSPNTWIFGITVRPCLIQFEGRFELEDNFILIAPPEVIFTACPKTTYEMYVIKISLPHLQNLCHTLYLPQPEQFLSTKMNGCRVVKCSPKQMQRVRLFLQQLRQTLLTFGVVNNKEERRILLMANQLKCQLEEDLTSQILLTIAEAQEIQPKKVLVRRANVLKQAEEYMLNHLKENVTTPNICQEIGVSKRTLEYIFKDFYQTSPKAYLKQLRLNYLRQSILKKPHLKINDLAEDLGFVHRGQLAGDYQELFAELPRETKARRGR